MDKATLVTVDLETGATILRILDNAKLGIKVALWVYLPEYDDWRLAFSSRRFDSASPAEAYGLIHDALKAAGLPFEKTPPILILRTTDSFIRALRKLFGKAKSVEGMRLGGQTIGSRFLEDAYVYRIS